MNLDEVVVVGSGDGPGKEVGTKTEENRKRSRTVVDRGKWGPGLGPVGCYPYNTKTSGSK